MKRRIAAILAADVAGFSRLVAEDEEETLRRLASHRQVFDDLVARYGGRIFNTAGDSVMCAFDSAVEAVRAAIDIQESLRTRNLAYPVSRRLLFRIGITIGDVVDHGGDLLGDGVNIAARLEGLAEPGGICISRSVHEAVANKVAVPFRDIGIRELKNIPQPVQAFAVAWPRSQAPADRRGTEWRAPREPDDRDDDMDRPRRWRLVIAPLLLLALIVVAVPVYRSLQSTLDDPPNPRHASATTTAGGLAREFADLTKTDRLVASPKTPAQHYHNARLYEAQGDVRNARRAFLDFANLKTEFIDGYLRLAAFVRAHEGRAASRDLFRSLAASHPGTAVALVHALQHDGAERRSRVEAFANANPDHPVASWFVAAEHSAEGLGKPTLTDRRLEFEALERFLEAEVDATLASHFLDQSVAVGWVADAKKRKSAAEEFFKREATRPTASFTRVSDAWKVTLTIPEGATSASYRIGDTGEFQAAAVSSGPALASGKPVTVSSLELPRDQERTVLYVAYRDPAGNEAGPFELNFDPHLALAENQRAALVSSPDQWVTFRKRDGGVTFNHLIAHRCAIRKVSVGFGDGALDNNLRLPPCDPAKPYEVPDDAHTYAAIPPNVERVAVRLTFTDDTESDVKTFARE